MGSKENNPALVRPSNFQGKRRSRTPDVNLTRFAQLLQQQPKETKEVSVSSFAANPKEEDENVEDEDPIMDSSSSKDPLNFVEYIADICAHYGKTEMSFETESTA